MREVAGNLWTYHDLGKWVGITTNCVTTAHGLAVMGRGVAQEAAARLPHLAARLGTLVDQQDFGDEPLMPVHFFPAWRLAAWPVKVHWSEPARPDLIIRGAHTIMAYLTEQRLQEFYTVRPGCGSGMLQWAEVKPLLDPIFDDRVIIVERPDGHRPRAGKMLS